MITNIATPVLDGVIKRARSINETFGNSDAYAALAVALNERVDNALTAAELCSELVTSGRIDYMERFEANAASFTEAIQQIVRNSRYIVGLVEEADSD